MYGSRGAPSHLARGGGAGARLEVYPVKAVVRSCTGCRSVASEQAIFHRCYPLRAFGLSSKRADKKAKLHACKKCSCLFLPHAFMHEVLLYKVFFSGYAFPLNIL